MSTTPPESKIQKKTPWRKVERLISGIKLGIFHIPTKVVYTFWMKALQNGAWLQKV